MPLPAILARLVIAALRKWAPRAVGAGLAALGIVEAADLAKEAWATFFGKNAAEAQEGARRPELAPPELVEFLETYETNTQTNTADQGDVIVEEELVRELDRATRRDPAADIAIQVIDGDPHSVFGGESCPS